MTISPASVGLLYFFSDEYMASPNHIHSPIKKEIQSQLDEIELQYSVKILYACESGSRAWGFASTDSDYDVRFIYMHEKERYLSVDVERRRDVIELPIEEELDITGWDLRKAMQLLRKSNPTLMEWLRSPVIYRQNDKAFGCLRELTQKYYSKRTCFYHYLSTAQRIHERYLLGDEIWLKKYFYVLRPILAVQWIDAKNEFPPMEFEKLVEVFIPEGNLKKAIQKLLKVKRSGKELQNGPRVEIINCFIEDELEWLQEIKPAKEPKADIEGINIAFREMLDNV